MHRKRIQGSHFAHPIQAARQSAGRAGIGAGVDKGRLEHYMNITGAVPAGADFSMTDRSLHCGRAAGNCGKMPVFLNDRRAIMTKHDIS